jgi:hypothetical protein
MMSFRLTFAALAVIAVPMVVAAQQAASAPAKADRRICRTNTELGSRLGRVRRCYTEAEYDAMKKDSRETVDRVQSINNMDRVPNQPGLSSGALPQ